MISLEVFSQKDSLRISRNLIYLEAAGAGGYGSVNYEKVLFGKKNLMFALRLGLGSYHIMDYTNKFNPDILIPLFVNAYYGKNHKIELGAGQIVANIAHVGYTDDKPTRTTNFHTGLSIGYRYQKNTGGIFSRYAYTPIIEFNKTFRHWVGVSFGYSF